MYLRKCALLVVIVSSLALILAHRDGASPPVELLPTYMFAYIVSVVLNVCHALVCAYPLTAPGCCCNLHDERACVCT